MGVDYTIPAIIVIKSSHSYKGEHARLPALQTLREYAIGI